MSKWIKVRNWFQAQAVMARMSVNWGRPGYDPSHDRSKLDEAEAEVKRLWHEAHG